jgi:hypothetical protein
MPSMRRWRRPSRSACPSHIWPRIHADGVGPLLVDHRLSPAVREALTAVGPVELVYYGPTTLNSARAFMAEVNVADGSLAAGVDQRAMSVCDLSGGMFDE